jgi:hypothetical protein
MKTKKIVLFMSLLPTVLATLSTAAKAEDYYHRDSREGRRSDWNRGFNDGVGCEKLLEKLRQAMCRDFYRNRYEQCGKIANLTFNELHPKVLATGLIGVNYIMSDYTHCKERRKGAFDRRVDRESDDWHNRNPNR